MRRSSLIAASSQQWRGGVTADGGALMLRSGLFWSFAVSFRPWRLRWRLFASRQVD